MKLEVIVQSIVTSLFANMVIDIFLSFCFKVLDFFHLLNPLIPDVYKNNNLVIRTVLFIVTTVVFYIFYSIKKDDDALKEIKEIKF